MPPRLILRTIGGPNGRFDRVSGHCRISDYRGGRTLLSLADCGEYRQKLPELMS